MRLTIDRGETLNAIREEYEHFEGEDSHVNTIYREGGWVSVLRAKDGAKRFLAITWEEIDHALEHATNPMTLEEWLLVELIDATTGQRFEMIPKAPPVIIWRAMEPMARYAIRR